MSYSQFFNNFMINNSQTLKKYPSVQYSDQHPQVNLFTVRDLEKTINPNNFIVNKDMCHCDLCTKQVIIDQKSEDFNLFEVKSKASTVWLKKLLDNLCLSGAKTLKINLPDLLFIVGESFETFQTNRKNSRLVKLSGTTPLKSLYPTMIRYRKEYKYMLELNFNQKMFESIDPEFMHLSYFDKFVPTHFHDGMSDIGVLKENRSQFKRYVLHKHKKYEIQQIEQHKMNSKQLFCIVKYTDGNCRLFTQMGFEVYMLGSLSKMQQQVVFVQSYLKYKLQTKAIYYSQYTLTPQSPLQELDRKAQNQVMVLLGALSKFDEGYTDPGTIDEISHHLMLHQPQDYVDLMTHKIVHYLNMTSRIYIDHIKIKWIINDLGYIYLQEIMDFQMSEVPRRLIRYRMPPKGQMMDAVSNTNNFGQLYLDMKKRKNVNTVRIKKMIAGKPADFVLDLMNLEQKTPQQQEQAGLDQESRYIEQYFKNKMKKQQETHTRSRTGTVQSNNNPPRLMKTRKTRGLSNNQARYASTEIKNRQNRSCTLETFAKPETKLIKEKIKLSFGKYFTIDDQHTDRIPRSGSRTHRPARMVSSEGKFNRYSQSTHNTIQVSRRYASRNLH